ncbi:MULTISPECIES: STAS domain-containing protein [Streptacidiphilus]|uniref:STAS domain-containing protein n=1 Tax=Streptacidiphilus cavernicola TaxID=3342716 RepID=A0ABV6UKW1_9ACTN|nr:STAS domain-containing protein [Streptacidiphilus jeojiense]
MTRPPLLDIVVVQLHDTTRLLLVGEIDLVSAPWLRTVVAEVLQEPGVCRIEVDTALVRFCDSSGLAAFVAVQRQAADQGVPLRLVEIPAHLRRVLLLTGFYRRLVPGP